MTLAELKKDYQKIYDAIISQQLFDAFELLRTFTQHCVNKDYSNQIDGHFLTYQSMLKYSFELADDPEKEKIYNKLLLSLLELADAAREDILQHQKLLGYYSTKDNIEKQAASFNDEAKAQIDQLLFEKELANILTEENVSSSNDSSQIIKMLFTRLWLTDKYRDQEIQLVNRICKEDLAWHQKALLVSAITLSLLRYFDEHKVELLFEFYNQSENRIWQRALTGIVLCLYYHDSRLFLYPNITNRLKSLQGDKKMEKNVEAIVIQFLRAIETEKITKKIQEELFPEIIKLKSNFEEKFDLENMIEKAKLEDENPDWEGFFEDSPDAFGKFEEFSKMQMEGGDVFMSAFGALKGFPFFQEISNWFVPFHHENAQIKAEMQGIKEGFDVDKFTESLEGSRFLCNSDKYSFCFNVKMIPAAQQNMMLDLFSMEIDQMNELSNDEELLDDTSANKAEYTQYLQDLYRFFKLHPMRKDFNDIFNTTLLIHSSYFLKHLLDNKQIIRNIGEYYFEKKYYQEAIGIFTLLVKEIDNLELLEKIGFANEKLGNIPEALKYYRQAEILETGKPWLLRKIAFCYRKLKKYDKALKYYKDVEKENPEDLLIQANIGHVYLEQENFEKALEYYYKVEYQEPNNYKISRPLAWCLLVTGKYNSAIKYLKKCIDAAANQNDYLNLGHACWGNGDKAEAIENYKLALKTSKGNFEWFSNSMKHDSKYLIGSAISALDIPLMLDYIKMNASI